MQFLSTKTRIAIGQGCLVACTLLVALSLKIVPDHGATVVEGRAKLCEAIAVNSSLLVARGDWKGLEANLRAVATHNKDILSVVARRSDGKRIVQIGDHSAWQELESGASTEAQFQVPLYTGNAKWGNVELRFQPLSAGGLRGVLDNPHTRLVAFVAATTLLVFMFYLGRVLEQLDPSKAVPGRVRSALNTLAEGLLVLDRSERIVLANDAIAGVLGKPPDKLVGVRASQLPWQTADGASGAAGYPWTLALREQHPQHNVMIQLEAATGEVKSFFVNCSPVLGHDGKYGGVFASFDDVTQLEENKRELRKSKEEAEEANRAKSDFLARMSHEIRTPMNAILGFTDVLRRGFDCDADERREYLNTIHSSGQHLLNLINDILDLSKVEAGKLQIELVRASPVQLIHEVVTVLRVRAQEKKIALDAVVASEMPETIVTDPVRLRQMLMNLVGNAIKFTETGGVKIVTRFARSQATPQLVIEVIDTGIGIARESLAKIFDPFSQADTSITRRFGGTGLGLTICRRFADALGGQLSVESEPGAGSVFTVTLDPGPLDDVRILDASAAVLPLAKQVEAERAHAKLPPARILVVDDGAENRKLLTLVLRRAGAAVETAANGQIAVELATSPGSDGFDLVLMDVEMPVMDGYAAVRALRDRGLATPIFALTAHAMKGDETKCRAAGFSGYLTKPIDLDSLLATLAAELEQLPRPLWGEKLQPTHNETGLTTGDSTCVGDRTDRRGPQNRPSLNGRPVPDSNAEPAESVGESSNLEPLVSTLPTDDPEFLEIVREFVTRLAEQLAAMDAAWQARDLPELARLAHWLKGSGGTAGFHDFTEPARELERSAKQNERGRIPVLLGELGSLARRIEVGEPALVVG